MLYSVRARSVCMMVVGPLGLLVLGKNTHTGEHLSLFGTPGVVLLTAVATKRNEKFSFCQLFLRSAQQDGDNLPCVCVRTAVQNSATESAIPQPSEQPNLRIVIFLVLCFFPSKVPTATITTGNDFGANAKF